MNNDGEDKRYKRQIFVFKCMYRFLFIILALHSASEFYKENYIVATILFINATGILMLFSFFMYKLDKANI